MFYNHKVNLLFAYMHLYSLQKQRVFKYIFHVFTGYSRFKTRCGLHFFLSAFNRIFAMYANP